MDYQLFFSIAANVIILPVLSLSLYIAYMSKREFLEDCGFEKPVVGIIIIGSFFGVMADIPLIISENALLNINLGGALIPLIVSGALIYKKKLNLISVAFGTIIVSLVAFYVTRIERNLGIVAEFPHYLFPPLSALAVSLILSFSLGRKDTYQIPYSYTVGVLGTLIGADLVRIPKLINIGVLGSIGGAGATDLVYLSGLIASVPLIFIYFPSHPDSLPSDLILRAKETLNRGRYGESKKYAIRAVEKEIQKAHKMLLRSPRYFQRPGNDTGVLYQLGIGQAAVKDYLTLTKTPPSPDPREIKKDLLTSKLLRDNIRKRINKIYTSFGRRFIAYLLDLMIISIPFLMFFFYIFSNSFSGDSLGLINSTLFIAMVSLSVSIQFIYFTLAEWYFGTTVGKVVLGLKVLDDDLEKITFLQSAARNSGRYADMALGFYLISVILILRSPDKKRIGDYIAGTRVVKTK